jgi:hypothetical protein
MLESTKKAASARLEKIGAAFGRFFRSPVYPVPLTLAVAFTSLFGSVYTNEIKGAPPFSWLNISAGHAVALFWLLFVISALLYYPREHVVEKDRREETAELIRRVRTLPPADFLALFAGVHDHCRDALLHARAKGDHDTYAQATRMILNSFAGLAKKFDSARPDSRYAANIMIFVRAGDLPDAAQRQALDKRLTFCDPEWKGLDRLHGALDVQRTLSATDDAADPDPGLIAFALPIPQTVKTKDNRWRALPGAPIAFIDGFDVYFDTSGLADWCARYGDFPQEVVRDLAGYFVREEGSWVKSFASVALRVGKSEPFGVLNLHRNEPGIFREREPCQQFFSVTRPLLAMLADLVSLWLRSRPQP